MAAVRLPVLTPRGPADAPPSAATSLNKSPTASNGGNPNSSPTMTPRPPVDGANGNGSAIMIGGSNNGPPSARTHGVRGSSMSIAPVGAGGNGPSRPAPRIGGSSMNFGGPIAAPPGTAGSHVIHRPPGTGPPVVAPPPGINGGAGLAPLPFTTQIGNNNNNNAGAVTGGPIMMPPLGAVGGGASTVAAESSSNNGSRTERGHRRPSSGSMGPTSPSTANGANNGAFTDRSHHSSHQSNHAPLERINSVSVAHWNGPSSPTGVNRTVTSDYENGLGSNGNDGTESVYDGLTTRVGAVGHFEKSPDNKLRAISENKSDASSMIAASNANGSDDVLTTEDWIAFTVVVTNHEKIGKHGHYDPSLSIWVHHHMWKKVTATHMQRDPDLANEINTTMLMSLDALCKNDHNRPFLFKYHIGKKGGAGTLIGEVETTLTEIMDKMRTQAPLDLLVDGKRKNAASLTVAKMDVYCNTTKAITMTKYPRLFPDATNELMYIELTGKTLEKMDLFGRADPFLEIYRYSTSKEWELAHQTEVFHETLDPHFKPITLRVQELCGGNYDRPILVKCFDWNANSSASLIGSFQTTTRVMLTPVKKGRLRKFELVHPDKRAKSKTYVHSGLVCLKACAIYTTQTELDAQSREYETRKTGKAKRDAYLAYLNSGATRAIFGDAGNGSANGGSTDVTSDEKKSLATHKVDKDKSSKGYISLTMKGEKLAKMDTFGSSDPFVQIFRYRKEQAKWEIVGATEHILNTTAPEWQPLVIKVKKIATDLGDGTRLLIRVLDWNRSTPPELIGEFQLTLGELKAANDQRFALVDSKKKEKGGTSYINSGILHFDSIKMIKRPQTMQFD